MRYFTQKFEVIFNYHHIRPIATSICVFFLDGLCFARLCNRLLVPVKSVRSSHHTEIMINSTVYASTQGADF